MRLEPTPQEALMWLELRKPPFAEYRFRRQHNDSQSDKERDAYLTSAGWKILRFWNNQLHDNLPGVIETIMQRLPAKPSPGSA